MPGVFEDRRSDGGHLRLLCMCQGWCMVQAVMGGQPFTMTVAEWQALPVQRYTPKKGSPNGD